VVTLGTALIVAVVAMAGIVTVRVQRSQVTEMADCMEARWYARSALDMALFRTEHDADWRQKMQEGVWETDRAVGNGTYRFQAVDPNDADLTNLDTDPVVIVGTGKHGRARQKLQVRLEPKADALSCLEVALFAGNDLSFTDTTVQCDQTIGANNNVTASSSTVSADVEAVGTISGSTYQGTNTAGVDPRSVPDSTVFDSYLATGTAIDVGALPLNAEGYREIRGQVLSPMSNPFGADLNAEGIYVIDCLGQQVVIAESRIVATVVLVNPASGSGVQNAVNWEPAVANYPALLVDGSMTLEFGNAPLSEATVKANFNPAGTPYLGSEDNDKKDEYPSLIRGLVYVSGDLTVHQTPTVEGVLVVGNTLLASGQAGSAVLTLTYQQTFLDNPPPGFGELRMVVVPGSFRQVVD